jgi:hypothetical protein
MARPIDRRKQAAARARQKASESQARHAGSDYLKWPGKKFTPKDKAVTLWSVIPYTVKERNHPDGADLQDQLWYKRPYVIHAGIGAGEYGKRVICPRTFHPRAVCSVCDDVEALRKSVRDRRKQLTEDEYKKEMDSASTCKGRNRDLMLIYDHNEKDVYLVDEAHGGGNMVGFGMLLDSRITNPLAEEWAAFYLDGDDGMALSITWAGSGSGGKMDWVKPISIDFVDRKKAPVPAGVWEKAVELSELLVKVSDKELWAMYQELPPEEEGDEEVTKAEEEPEEPEPEEEPEEETEQNEWDSMSRSELKTFIKEKGLNVRVVKSMSDEDIRTAVAEAMGEEEPEGEPEEEDPPFEEPEPVKPATKTRTATAPATKEETKPKVPPRSTPPKAGNKCPGGGTFGKDFNELDACAKSCPDAVYDECGAAN